MDRIIFDDSKDKTQINFSTSDNLFTKLSATETDEEEAKVSVGLSSGASIKFDLQPEKTDGLTTASDSKKVFKHILKFNCC